MTDIDLEQGVREIRQAIARYLPLFRDAPDRHVAPMGPWGPKEALAHLLWWHLFSLHSIEEVLAGHDAPAPWGDREGINAVAAVAYSSTPIDQIADGFVDANDRLIAAMSQLHDQSAIIVRRCDGTTFTAAGRLMAVAAHIRKHADEIETQKAERL